MRSDSGGVWLPVVGDPEICQEERTNVKVVLPT